MTKYKIPFLVFLFLATAATLFPPFRWGEEKLRTERERRRLAFEFDINPTEVLPVKKYGFLFGDSKQQFQVWGWDEKQKQSIPRNIILERQLITTELLLEYFLALVIACVVYVILPKSRSDKLTGSQRQRRGIVILPKQKSESNPETKNTESHIEEADPLTEGYKVYRDNLSKPPEERQAALKRFLQEQKAKSEQNETS